MRSSLVNEQMNHASLWSRSERRCNGRENWMPDHSITFAQSVRKELERLSTSVVRRIFPRIEDLARDPRPPGCRKLQGFENLWRIRIQAQVDGGGA